MDPPGSYLPLIDRSRRRAERATLDPRGQCGCARAARAPPPGAAVAGGDLAVDLALISVGPRGGAARRELSTNVRAGIARTGSTWCAARGQHLAVSARRRERAATGRGRRLPSPRLSGALRLGRCCCSCGGRSRASSASPQSIAAPCLSWGRSPSARSRPTLRRPPGMVEASAPADAQPWPRIVSDRCGVLQRSASRNPNRSRSAEGTTSAPGVCVAHTTITPAARPRATRSRSSSVSS